MGPVLVVAALCVLSFGVLLAVALAQAAGVWNDCEDGSEFEPSGTENNGE